LGLGRVRDELAVFGLVELFVVCDNGFPLLHLGRFVFRHRQGFIVTFR
jgi:hypothetical protein